MNINWKSLFFPLTGITDGSIMNKSKVIEWVTIRRNFQIEIVLVGFISLIAVGFRFYKLGEWSFWYDEMFTIRDLGGVFEAGLRGLKVSRILIGISVSYLGINEWSARLAPALVGILTIPAIYIPTRKIFGVPVALLGGLLLGVSTWHLYWSQNVRFYTTLLLFYSLALFLFYFGIEKDRPWYLVLSMVFLGLAVLERLFALFLVPVVILYLVAVKLLPFEKPAGLKLRNILLILLPGILVGPVVGWRFIQSPALWLESFGWINNNPLWLFSGFAYYVGIPVLCLGFAGAIYLLLKKERIGLLLFLSAVIPITSIMFISMFQYAANRYAFVSLSSWIILASVAVISLLRYTPKGGWILAAGIIAVMIVDAVGDNLLYYRYQHGNRDDWKSAFEYIRKNKEPGDRVAVTNTLIGNYYLKEATFSIERQTPEIFKNNPQRTWIVEDMNLGEKNPQLLAWIQKNADLRSNFDVIVLARNFKMRVYLYTPPLE